MQHDITLRVKPYIQPFELNLAIEEAIAVGKAIPATSDQITFRMSTRVPVDELAGKLAYWELVSGDTPLPTVQSLREATVNVVRNGVPLRHIQQTLPFVEDPPLPNRRCLRYGPHGIHEYRGKFFPQLVRSLLNIADCGPGSLVADPMCGSGTAPLEAVLAGCEALALDMNPLSVELTRAKCDLLRVQPNRLESIYEDVKSRLLGTKPSRAKRLIYFESLATDDQQYLRRWFSEDVLRDLDQIMLVITKMANARDSGWLRIVLSNIIRKVSWQKDDDLRVRREVRTDIDIDPVREFLEELGRSVRLVLAFARQTGNTRMGSLHLAEGDARELYRVWSHVQGKVDAVITSPPYATALPYLETDRLSLSYLKLLPRKEQRKRDDLMVGNREVTERGRMAYWRLFEQQQHLLPDAVRSLIRRIDKLNTDGNVGFRRRNLAALLAKYFLDMRVVLSGVRRILRRGARAYVVVGDNHTTAGGEPVAIRTAEMLADIGAMIGLKEGRHRPMDMLTSRDIFRKNAMASETILEFSKR